MEEIIKNCVNVRMHVFETNSSMTHSMTMCKESSYKDWIEGKAKLNLNKGEILPLEEAEKKNDEILRDEYEKTYKKYHFTGDFEDYREDLFTDNFFNLYISVGEYQDYVERHYFEEFKYTYNQENDNIVAFGYYGKN